MFRFELLENEKLIVMYRQTEWVLAKSVLLVFLLIYLPWFFLIKYELARDFRRLLLAWTIMVSLYAVHKYLLWLLNVYILTNKRLVSVHYVTLVSKRISESPLDMIVNISLNTKGLASSLLNFGDLQMQVANSTEPFIMKNVSKPSKIKDFLWKIQHRTPQSAVRYSHQAVAPSVKFGFDKQKSVK